MEREEREEERSMSLIWSSLIPRLEPGNEARYGSKLSTQSSPSGAKAA